MKKNKVWLPVSIVSLVGVAIAFVVLTNPPPSDTLIPPYLTEPIIPLNHQDINQTVEPTSLLNRLENAQAVVLPDNSVIQVGQILTDSNFYAPALVRTNLGDGAIWTTFFNPTNDEGIEYDATGTSVNTINQVIYVNPSRIYLIGTIRAKLVDIHGTQYPLRGIFGEFNIPVGNDILVFVASITEDFYPLTFHGFITPVDEEGEQATIVADATLLDSNTMALVGVTNSQAGLFVDSVNKAPKDFVISVDIQESITLNHLFTFDNSSYVQNNRVYALASGDLVVSGNFQEADGDFASIPLTQQVESPAFVARINGETFTLEWVSSNLKKATLSSAVTEYLNVLELDNHHLVTVANVWQANETYDQHIIITVFTETGKIQLQTKLDLDGRDASALRLYKSTTGYWIAGTIKDGAENNIMVIKLSASLKVTYIHEIIGSNQELFMIEPFLLSSGGWFFVVGTYSRDVDYGVLQNEPEGLRKVAITLYSDQG